MNKKFIYTLLITLFCITAYMIYSNTYQSIFVKNHYFNQKYEKTDSEYVDTMMLGDVIMFEEDKIIILKAEDYGKFRKNLAKEKGTIEDLLLIPPGNGMKTLGYIYQNPKYNFFQKEITANDMPSIKILSKTEIEFEGVKYSLENDKMKIFFNGEMPYGNRLIMLKSE